MTAATPAPFRSPTVPFARPEVCAEAQSALARVLSSGWLTTGPECVEFEREMAVTTNARHAVAVSSCTAAIEIALRSMRLPPGARVLTSTLTFCGVVHAILNAGLRPVLVDVDANTLMPDAATTDAACHREGPADAMVVLHYGGHPADVQELADAAGLPLDRVVEDAAHALGTRVAHRDVGAISAATCFSFYATKNLPIGEGGMITTDDADLADFARRARLHGMSSDSWRRYQPGARWRYSVEVAGIKANMTDLQAALGRAQLRHFDAWQERRAELAALYDRHLDAIPGLVPPARPGTGRHAWHLYVVRVQPEFGMDRDALFAFLAERGVHCSVHFIPVHHLPYFRSALGDAAASRLPVADAVFDQILSLPFYPALTDEQVAHVGAAILDARRRARTRLGAAGVTS
ncbi:MAG TPA: DegT/DnrJ/EryC1/StrS family aminotransferase [Candidatus Dormibacteraeota bacterium]|nr:DegT/DnrJ/EryC1/StrS family aminotransferase [Candidatus Dormibacteraeota bacterium]